MALLMALWFAAGAAILAMAFLQGTRSETAIATGVLGETRARLAEDAALAWAVARLLDEEIVLRPGGTPIRASFEGIELDLLVSAESGRIDVNYAAVETLAELAGNLGIEEAEVEAFEEALADWREDDGAEGVDMERPRLGSRLVPPRHHHLEHVAGLRTVPGVPPAVYRALAPWLTVYTREPMPDNGLLPPLLRVTPRGGDMPASDGQEAASAESGASPEAAPSGLADDTGIAGEDGESEAAGEGDGRRSDPLQLYRVRIATRQPDGYTSGREIVLWLRPGRSRPYRILDFSPPLVVPSEEEAGGSRRGGGPDEPERKEASWRS